MESKPEFSLSPEKLRVNYTLASKSNKVIAVKKPLAEPETRPETVTNRVNSAASKLSSAVNVRPARLARLAKLQEELDSDELAIRLSSLKSLPAEQRAFGESLIYEKYIDKAVHLLKTKDRAAGKALAQAWSSFKSCNAARLEQSSQSSQSSQAGQLRPGLNRVPPESKTQSTQISEELLKLHNEAEIESYISSLHRAIKGINQLQISKIIEKLQELHRSMRPAALPELSEAPEVTQLDFTDTIKSIHTRLKARLKPKKSEEAAAQARSLHAGSQTYVSLEDFRYEEVYKVLLLELENRVADLAGKLRKKEDAEDRLAAKARECEELRRKYIDVKTTSCVQCRVKRSLIDSSSSQIRSLEMTVEKGFMIEKELVKAKQQLAESRSVILSKDKKIVDLKANVDELCARVQETNEIKEILEGKLETSTKELEQVIEVLENSEKHRLELESLLRDQNSVNEDLKKRIQLAVEQSHKLRLMDSSFNEDKFDSKETGIDFNFSALSRNHKQGRIESTEKYERAERAERTERTETRKNTFSNSNSNRTPTPNFKPGLQHLASPDKKAELIRPDLFRPAGSKSSEGRKVEKQTMMKWLNITREEYLALSKKVRVELYECLYEHREKCGADCEHLRRAMMIKQKERGTLFPTKKYNIN